MSGLSTLRDGVFRPGSMDRVDPAGMIARDMARVMDRFGRSAACSRRALEAGVKIEDLEAGCTENGDSPESLELSSRHSSPHRDVAKSID
jgi:hypothetical protein